jgi:8-oxo-dGTP pyrophosphatase MutT (NUDIX family)
MERDRRKVEPGEPWGTAMVREFVEETGLETNVQDWEHRITLTFPTALVRVYFAKCKYVHQVRTLTDERVLVVPLMRLEQYPLMGNIMWLVHMMLDNHIIFPQIVEGNFG